MSNVELRHWGIKGMKWGVRRYQNRDGSLTAEGKKRYGDSDGDNKPKETREEAKARVVKTGTAAEALKFSGELTQAEMQYISTRIRWEQEMRNASEREIDTGKSKVDEIFGGIDKATGHANTAAKAWNTVANVVNAFNDSDVTLPRIDTNITSGNKAERKAEKKSASKHTDVETQLKKMKDLNDDEVKDLLNRMNNEKKINDLKAGTSKSTEEKIRELLKEDEDEDKDKK